MFPKTIERRVHPARAEYRDADSGPVFFGRAAVYSQWSVLLYGTFRERIAPGAFDKSLASGNDIIATVNHDLNRILGRSSSKTLSVLPSEEGIDVEVSGGDYSYAKDLAIAIKRDDLRGMSFIFDVRRDSWVTEEGIPHRTVLEADIYEVSFVYSPAYEQTVANVRGTPLAIPLAGEERAKYASGIPRKLNGAKLRLAEVSW